MRLRNYFKFSWVTILLLLTCSGNKLPIYGELPAFRLTTQDEKTLNSEELKGKVWVVNFIFTSCRGACPLLTQRMKRVDVQLQERFKQNADLPLRILSFSVDPERDTPPKLKEYTKTYGIDSPYWLFLTGPVDEITQTVVQGFKTSMVKSTELEKKEGKEVSAGEVFDVIHSEKFVLVDAKGQIRGYYDSEESTQIRKLLHDVDILIKEAS